MTNVMINDSDKALLSLLAANSRASVSELARKLGLSRTTVKDRIARLEKHKIITGYTVRFSEEFSARQILAHVMINSDPKHAAEIVRHLGKMPTIKALHTVNGIYDMIAMIRTESTKELDQVLDDIGALTGIEKTVSSIILTTKFDR